MPWIATALLVFGRYYMGKTDKARVALGLSFVGDTLWTMVGLQIGGMNGLALAFTGGLMAILDLAGWRRHKNNNKYWNSMVVPNYMRSGYKI